MRKVLIVSSSDPMIGSRIEPMILSGTPYEVVGTSFSVESALEMAKTLSPEVILIDNSALMGSGPFPIEPFLDLNIPIIEANFPLASICLYKEGERTLHSFKDFPDALIQIVEPPIPWEDLSPEEILGMTTQRLGLYTFLTQAFCQKPKAAPLKEAFLKELPFPKEPLSKEIRDGLARIWTFLDQAKDLKDTELDGLIASDYERLFLGPEAPLESTFRYATVGVALRGLYDQEGLILQGSPDAFSTELEFLSHLVAKELKALQEGDEEGVLQALESQQAFFLDHILRWVPTCLEAMEKKAMLGLYKGLIGLSRGYVKEEASYLSQRLSWLREGRSLPKEEAV
jgi:TorA maturation chaperone TorD